MLKEEAINYVAPLQVLGDKRSENIVVAKNITLLRSAQCKDCAGGRSTYNTTIERFLRDHITNIIVHFTDEFEKLEHLGVLDADNSTDMKAFHCVRILVSNRKIDHFKEFF